MNATANLNHQLNLATAILMLTEKPPTDPSAIRELAESAKDLAEAVVKLHKHLKAGGELPAPWER